MCSLIAAVSSLSVRVSLLAPLYTVATDFAEQGEHTTLNLIDISLTCQQGLQCHMTDAADCLAVVSSFASAIRTYGMAMTMGTDQYTDQYSHWHLATAKAAFAYR